MSASRATVPAEPKVASDSLPMLTPGQLNAVSQLASTIDNAIDVLGEEYPTAGFTATVWVEDKQILLERAEGIVKARIA